MKALIMIGAFLLACSLNAAEKQYASRPKLTLAMEDVGTEIVYKRETQTETPDKKQDKKQAHARSFESFAAEERLSLLLVREERNMWSQMGLRTTVDPSGGATDIFTWKWFTHGCMTAGGLVQSDYSISALGRSDERVGGGFFVSFKF